MEFRVYMVVRGPPAEEEARWQPLMEALEQDPRALGSVIGWGDGSGPEILLAVSADDKAEAADVAMGALTSALHAADLGDRHATRLEVERGGPDRLTEVAEDPERRAARTRGQAVGREAEGGAYGSQGSVPPAPVGRSRIPG